MHGYPVNDSKSGLPYEGCGGGNSGQLSAVPGTLLVHGARHVAIRNCTCAHLGRTACAARAAKDQHIIIL